MPHTEFAPHPNLAPNINRLWTLTTDPSAYNQHAITPDSYLELVINCGSPLLLQFPDGAYSELPPVTLTPLQQIPIHLRATGDVQLIGLRLYAWQNLIDLPQSADPMIGLSGIWNEIAQTLTTTLNQKGHDEAINALQQIVTDLTHRPDPDLTLIQRAGELLYRTEGKARMSDLATQAHLSHRQFERRFKHFTGVSPKTLARLIRFESIRETMMLNPTMPLAALAHDFGYTDQAHFIHDFKSFASRTPRVFAADGLGRWAELAFSLRRPRPRNE